MKNISKCMLLKNFIFQRTMTADVNNNNMKHEVNILVVGPIMHRYLVANLLQMPSNSWNRITPPQPGSVSIVQVRLN